MALLLAQSGCGPAEGRVVATDDTRTEIDRPRGRVSVVDGTLRTDRGSPLRGVLIPVDVIWPLDDFDLIDRIATESGLNTLHVYLENWQQPAGTHRNEADALVALTAQAGLYLVLGIGGGPAGPDHPGNGWFDPNLVRAFWDVYAPRYANRTHVLYEIINNPEINCAEPFADATMDMELQTYAQIRALAPDTHVVMFSTSAVPEPAVIADAIGRSEGVDFTNASFAIHGDATCVGLDRLDEVEAAFQATKTPTLMTQLPPLEWASYIPELEARRIGWMHHEWLARVKDIESLIEAHRSAGLSWCPDQGTFPEDAATCAR